MPLAATADGGRALSGQAGRPPLPEGAARRRRIGFAVTEDELSVLTRAARPGRVGPAARRAALEWAASTAAGNAEAERVRRATRDRTAQREAARAKKAGIRTTAGQIARVGNNLNQAVRALHARDVTDGLLETVEAARVEVRKALALMTAEIASLR